MDQKNRGPNPLGTEPVGKLLIQYAIPSIVATLIASLYNMVDQMFIGQRIGFLVTACYWLIPHQILLLFGSNSGGYEAFAIRFMHEFLLLVILSGIVPISMNAMVSIKKPRNGIIISLSKQLVLIALLLILPRIFGIDGVLWSGPVADLMVAIAAFVVIRKAFRELDSLPAA